MTSKSSVGIVSSARRLLLAAALSSAALVGPSAAPATVTETPLQASAGGVTAQLFYRKLADYRYQPLRIRIVRRGSTLVDAAVPPHPDHPTSDFLFLGYPPTRVLAVRDLDGDREPEVLLDLNWGGAHCCDWTRVYHFDRLTGRYRVTVRLWGDVRPTLRDLNADGKPEFVGKDTRFAYAFTSYAFSYFPVQIWTFQQGRFVDVTRSLPAQLRSDAAQIASRIPSLAPDARGAGAAWAAEQALLGRAMAAHRQMTMWAQQGLFDGDPNSYSDLEPVGAAYVGAVWRFLRKNGYLR
jgi:hypothetical protein